MKDKIIKKIKSKKRGWVFCAKDFVGIANRNAVDKNLCRLVDDAFIVRVDRGVYYYPFIHKDFGVVPPDVDDVARAVARSLGVDVFPSGARSANILGLSNQVPAQNVYLTNGRSFKKTISGDLIHFKHSKINLKTNSNQKIILILNALQHLGKSKIDYNVIAICSSFLTKLDKKYLQKISGNFSAWMSGVILKLINLKDAEIC